MFNKRNSIVKLLAFVFVITICFSINNTYASSLSDYEKQLDDIRRQESENIKKLSGVEKTLAKYNYDIVSLDIQMNEETKKLIEIEEKIKETNEAIKEQEDSLSDTSKLYEKAQQEYLEKLRIVYENGMPNIIEMLIDSKGISDFIRRINVYTSILEYYQTKSGSIKNQKEYIDYVKKDMEAKKLQIEQLKKSVEKSTTELANSLEKKKQKVEELEKSQSSLQENIDALTQKKVEAMKLVDEEIEKIVRNALYGDATFTGGQFAWPVDGYNIITTRFGTIYNLVRPEGSAHTGCDVAGAGILGKPIRAIESGKVMTAKYGNYGYGNYVIIDHGKSTTDNNNYISLYAHATTLAVDVGDEVEKGDIIAYVGSTGNSTGPHLHLEIRVNGKITDPLAYYPAMEFKYPYG